jgi:hypothetical protein
MLNFTKKSLSLTLIALSVFAAVSANADPYSGLRVGVNSRFGFGGDAVNQLQGYTEQEPDAEATTGVGLRLEYPITNFFHLAFGPSFHWSKDEVMDNRKVDRTLHIDISPALKLRTSFHNERGELYIDVPVGLTVTKVSDEEEDLRFGQMKADTGLGWNAAVMVGTNYRVHNNVSLQIELGWQGRGGSLDVSQGNTDLEYEYSTHQFALNVGAFYTF